MTLGACFHCSSLSATRRPLVTSRDEEFKTGRRNMVSSKAKTVSFVFRGELSSRGVSFAQTGTRRNSPSQGRHVIAIIGNHAAHVRQPFEASAVPKNGTATDEGSMAAIPESYRVLVMSNIVSGRQIRAARMLAGLTQADLARATGCHPRSVRYWENKGSNPPTNVASTLDSIEQAFNRYGVIIFSTPTPGVRCSD